ncbi:MAG: hypothetical protein FWC27_15650, partial [Firmicutes bacterium]|nr:hypothetical protein [Bacillota bacterium]
AEPLAEAFAGPPAETFAGPLAETPAGPPAAAPPCDCEAVPVILLSGGHGALTENYGQPDEMWYYGTDMLSNLLRDGLPVLRDDVLPSLLTFDLSKILDALLRVAWAWVGPLEMLPDGTSVKQLERINEGGPWVMSMDHRDAYYWSSEEVPVGEAYYRFPFDWRQSPYDVAEELNDYVQMIKAHTGHAHVHISSISGSSSPLLAYTEKYIVGVNDPDALSVVYNQPTAFGMELVGNFLNADYSMNPRNAGAFDYIYTLDLPSQANDIILTLMRVFYYLGFLNNTAFGFSLWTQAVFDRIYEDVTRRTYAAWPGMWSWCPPEDFDTARARLIDGHPEYAQLGFLEKIDRYHALQLRGAEVLRAAGDKIKVAVVVGYDMGLLPLGKDKHYNSDGMVAAQKASLGAVVAPLGKRLPAGYTQAVDDGHGRISPDRKIDASTCALPEYTWFVKDMVHRDFYHLHNLYNWWRTAPKGEDTVSDNPEYPQFMRLEDKAQTNRNSVLLPMTAEEPTWKDGIMDAWDTVMRFLFGVLEWVAVILRIPLGWIFKIWF